MSLFETIANKAKDIALQHVASRILNKYHLNKLGKMTSLRLDSEKQEIFIELDLHGEQTPIELTVKYRVLSSTLIEIADVQSSRAWITTLANEIVPADQKRITVPEAVTAALSKIIR